MKYQRLAPPVPVEETPDLIQMEDDWNDKFTMIPADGILHDFYLHTLGWEVTNLYAFWTGIAGLSSLASREVELKSAMTTFPNFYVILVGPPGIAKKSTAMKLWEKVETKMWPLLAEHLVEIKKVPMIRSKATPEFLFTQMANRDLEHNPGSESNAVLKVRVSELDNFLSRASYNGTLISKLTDFYDCQDYDTDGVLGRNNGKLAEIRNIYASLFGCTTPTALKDTLPEEAFGGGFMSRTTIVSQDVEDITRVVEWPFFPTDAPDRDELAERLAWITTYKNGQYTLTDEAMSLYRSWYRQVHAEILRKAKNGDSDDRDNRITTQALKLALLLSYQRYDLDRRVTYIDMLTAVNIIDWTMEKATKVIDEASMSLGANSKLLRFYRVVKGYGAEGVTQTKLGRTHNYKVAEIEEYFKEMQSRNTMRLEIVTLPPKKEGGRSARIKTYYAIDEKDNTDE